MDDRRTRPGRGTFLKYISSLGVEVNGEKTKRLRGADRRVLWGKRTPLGGPYRIRVSGRSAHHGPVGGAGVCRAALPYGGGGHRDGQNAGLPGPGPLFGQKSRCFHRHHSPPGADYRKGRAHNRAGGQDKRQRRSSSRGGETTCVCADTSDSADNGASSREKGPRLRPRSSGG